MVHMLTEPTSPPRGWTCHVQGVGSEDDEYCQEHLDDDGYLDAEEEGDDPSDEDLDASDTFDDDDP